MYSKKSGGFFTFKVDVTAKEEGLSTQNNRLARPGTRGMEVDAVAGIPSYYDARWEQEYEETECTPCGSGFHRH